MGIDRNLHLLSSAGERFHGFVQEVLIFFGAEYVCIPNEEDLESILGINALRGFFLAVLAARTANTERE